jgi:hypothetical protein
VRRRAGRVEALADVQVELLEGRRPRGALVAGPAAVLDRAEHIRDAVDLLPAAEADVADPQLARLRPERDPERVAEAVQDHTPRVEIRAREERVRGQRSAVVGVDADDRPVEGDRVAACAQVLRPQRSPLGRRRRERGADAAGRVAARVHRAAVLAPVGEAEGGAVACRGIQRAVGPELELALRVARVLLAPVLHEHRLLTGRVEPREMPGNDAPVDVSAGRVRARIRGRAHRPPARRGPSDGRVARVEDVDVGVGRKLGVEHHSQQAAVPVVVHLRAQVGVDGRGGVREAVEDLDQAALLGDEHAPVRREADDHRVDEPAERDLLLEAGRQRGAARRRSGREQAKECRNEKQTPRLTSLRPCAGRYNPSARGPAQDRSRV